MTAFDSIRAQVLVFPVKERFDLWFDILDSLPPPPARDDENDGGVADANRRWEQDKNSPDAWLNHEEFVAAVTGARRK